MLYPIGLPTIIDHPVDNPTPHNKRKFFNKYEELKDELIDNLWVADISTKNTNKDNLNSECMLNFDQDFIYSSLDLKLETINRCASGLSDDDFDEDESEIKKIPNKMSLEINRIVHGKLTSNNLKIIDKVASSKEKADLKRKITYDSVIYYGESNRYDDPIEWAKHILTSPPGVEIVDGQIVDHRSRAFFPIPLENFIGKMNNERSVIKKDRNKHPKDSSEYIRLDAKQEFLKLVVNTFYGVSASIYFSLGNVVIANNITDGIRCAAWMLSKGLRTLQEITDGGMYSPKEIAFLGSKLPGLNTFAKWERWTEGQEKRLPTEKRTLGSLDGIDWDNEFNELIEIAKKWKILKKKEPLKGKSEELEELLKSEFSKIVKKCNHYDDIADNHLKYFWSKFGLEYVAGVEHKLDHISKSMAYEGKGNYIFYSVLHGLKDPARRGSRRLYKDDIQKGCVENPVFTQLEDLAIHGDFVNFRNCEYDTTQLTKIAEWCNAPEDSHTNLNSINDR